jgi:hypothetical protein
MNAKPKWPVFAMVLVYCAVVVLALKSYQQQVLPTPHLWSTPHIAIADSQSQQLPRATRQADSAEIAAGPPIETISHEGHQHALTEPQIEMFGCFASQLAVTAMRDGTVAYPRQIKLVHNLRERLALAKQAELNAQSQETETLALQQAEEMADALDQKLISKPNAELISYRRPTRTDSVGISVSSDQSIETLDRLTLSNSWNKMYAWTRSQPTRFQATFDMIKQRYHAQLQWNELQKKWKRLQQNLQPELWHNAIRSLIIPDETKSQPVPHLLNNDYTSLQADAGQTIQLVDYVVLIPDSEGDQQADEPTELGDIQIEFADESVDAEDDLLDDSTYEDPFADLDLPEMDAFGTEIEIDTSESDEKDESRRRLLKRIRERKSGKFMLLRRRTENAGSE